MPPHFAGRPRLSVVGGLVPSRPLHKVQQLLGLLCAREAELGGGGGGVGGGGDPYAGAPLTPLALTPAAGGSGCSGRFAQFVILGCGLSHVEGC
jgi:hypothetical protein